MGTIFLIFRSWKLHRNIPKTKCQSCIWANINFTLVPHSLAQKDPVNPALDPPERARPYEGKKEKHLSSRWAGGAFLPVVSAQHSVRVGWRPSGSWADHLLVMPSSREVLAMIPSALL